ncbi:conserved hypothetical protein [Pediculus humanus corporis]|uniref:Nucleolar protein 4 helical domain-containing protein n=1 Tax=Pediculus humanus subsp. corporis TaxID=121224 RepID=E0VUW1_PEDHC|nr:uncharacterized protein Phum_PHUM456130 [Pediculus humanus corporis]EEB17167.1 conserved hypothetical protein [Pediculus humanus corporis]
MHGSSVEEITSAAETDGPDEEPPRRAKEAEKLKMMLLAWSGGRNGEILPDDVQDEASQIWAGYHNALSLSKQTPPIRSVRNIIRKEKFGHLDGEPKNLFWQLPSPTQETGSVHDETSSSGNKDDDDDEEEECEEKIDPLKYDPERLKAFNMFVRLFVDENLDRIVPISKQPKEKIQAIIDSCTRQFPEFSERARKRIRTYLKSCRRNKRTREGNAAWEPSRPTPAHLTSVQAEQILAQACENESHNAKRMRLGLEPVTQPMPGITTDTSTTVRSLTNNEGTTTRERDHYTSPVSSTNTVEKHNIKHEPNSGSVSPTVQNKTCSLEALAIASANNLSPNLLNGSAPPASVAAAVAAAAAAPTAMYRPNFSQAFQKAGTGGGGGTTTYTTPGLFSLPCSLTNGTRPTDLSMKNKPLLTHKLNPAEMTAVRQLITGYRESAAFLLRSADELEQLLRNQ